MREEAAAETKRIAAMRRICAGRFPEIEAQAIQEGWDEPRCELAVLREGRPKAPAMHVRHNSNTVSAAMLEAACMTTAKLGGVENFFDEPTLEASHKRFHGGIGLKELLLEAAWANGYMGHNFREARDVLRFAFHPELEARGSRPSTSAASSRTSPTSSSWTGSSPSSGPGGTSALCGTSSTSRRSPVTG